MFTPRMIIDFFVYLIACVFLGFFGAPYWAVVLGAMIYFFGREK